MQNSWRGLTNQIRKRPVSQQKRVGAGTYQRKRLRIQISWELYFDCLSNALQMRTSTSNRSKEPREMAPPGGLLQTICIPLQLLAQIPQAPDWLEMLTVTVTLKILTAKANSVPIMETRTSFIHSFIQQILECLFVSGTEDMKGWLLLELCPPWLMKESSPTHQSGCPPRWRKIPRKWKLRSYKKNIETPLYTLPPASPNVD